MEGKEIEKGTVPEGYEKDGADTERNDYERYQALGGIINEKDYKDALARAKEAKTLDKTLVTQAEMMARQAGIELETGDALDPRVSLYGILRRDTNTAGAEYHHSQMADQRLFVEALRMLGDEESLKKFVEAHPHISFEYERG